MGTYQELASGGFDFARLLQENSGDVSSEAPKLESDHFSTRVKELKLSKGDEADDGMGKLVDEEERKTGAVEFKVYKKYMLSTGGILFLLFLLLVSVLLTSTQVMVDVWLSVWTDERIQPEPGVAFYLGIYLVIAGSSVVIAATRQFAWAKGFLSSSNMGSC
jgi:hypothetical protein